MTTVTVQALQMFWWKSWEEMAKEEASRRPPIGGPLEQSLYL